MAEYRIGTYVRKADPGIELVILEFSFDAREVPKQRKVSLGRVCVVGSAGEELGNSGLGTVEGGAFFPLAGQDIILQAPAGSGPKTAVIKADEGEGLTFQLDKLLRVPR